MESYSREFALFLDGIRIEKGLSRIDLIEGIVSLSQYKRYLRGAASIPNNLVMELADRLNYNITDLYNLYTKKHNKDDNDLRQIYKQIQSYNYDNALISLGEINRELLMSAYYKSWYDYYMILCQHKLGRVSDIHVLSMYTDLIDYPACMKKDSFSFVEISTLDQIIHIASKMDNYEPANICYKVFTSENFQYSTSSDTSILPPLYYSLARVFWGQESYDQTIQLCLTGINFALKDKNSNDLPQLFYITGRAYGMIGDKSNEIVYLKKCFMQLIINQDMNVYNTFKNLYEKAYDSSVKVLLSDLNNLIK